jgi:hypothetical protein
VSEPACDRCGDGRPERVEVIVGPEPLPRLSVMLCSPCRAPLMAFTAGVRQAILAGIR